MDNYRDFLAGSVRQDDFSDAWTNDRISQEDQYTVQDPHAQTELAASSVWAGARKRRAYAAHNEQNSAVDLNFAPCLSEICLAKQPMIAKIAVHQFDVC